MPRDDADRKDKDDAKDSKNDFVARQAKENHAKLVRQLRRRLPRGADPDDAKDLAQKTYIELLRSGVKFEGVRLPFSYLMKAALHVAAQYLKKRAEEEQRLSIDSEAIDARAEKPRFVDRDPVLDALVIEDSWQRTYAGLTPEQKQVLDLKAEGMSIQEIAVMAGLTPDQVERRLTDAYDHMETLHHELVQGKVRK